MSSSDESDDELNVLVVDAGRLRFRLGRAGEENPDCTTDDGISDAEFNAAMQAHLSACGLEAGRQLGGVADLAAWYAGVCGRPVGGAEQGQGREEHPGRLVARLLEAAAGGLEGAAACLWAMNCRLLRRYVAGREAVHAQRFETVICTAPLMTPADGPEMRARRQLFLGAHAGARPVLHNPESLCMVSQELLAGETLCEWLSFGMPVCACICIQTESLRR